MAARSPAPLHFQVGSRVELDLGGRNVVGTVVEDRGPLAAGGGQLVRVQLDWVDVAEPVELETASSCLRRRVMTGEERKNLERVVAERSTDRQSRIAAVASRLFHGSLRHVSLGLWPEKLAETAQQSLGGTVSVQDATGALDAMAKVGAVVRKSSDLYVASDWLLQHLDRAA